MTPSNPFTAIAIVGNILMRGITLALPSERVRNLLPAGLELGPQEVTPKGTHPVVLLFNETFRGHWSVPTLIPNMTYREHTVGVPFSYLSSASITPGHPGPYHFMPKLYLDDAFAFVGGLAFYGFAKEIASLSVTADRYTVTSLSGQRLTSLSFKSGGEDRPVADYPNFEPVRQMLAQPLISMAPVSVGPFFVLSDFDKTWELGTIRPIQTVVDVDVEFIPGYPAGRYPPTGEFPGIDSSVLGSYELRVPYRFSLPYPPMLSFRR